MPTRRAVIGTLPATVAAWLVACGGADGVPLVDEQAPAAAALGYVADATRTNKTKFPVYTAGARCDTCAFFEKRSGWFARTGGCALLVQYDDYFRARDVSAAGWCKLYVRQT